MALIHGILPHWNHHRTVALVDRVTARIQNSVWHRVRDRVPAMSVHEARGYIRARAAVVIQHELDLVMLDEPQLGLAQRSLVARLVGQHVVRRVMLENVRRQDSRQIRRRMAA